MSYAENRRARFDYFIEDKFEAGIVLTGTEVKSIVGGKVNISESYVSIQNGTLQLINCSIEQYENARFGQHEVRRPRILLMKKREIAKLDGKLKKGMSIIPLSLYATNGKIKLSIGLATGKKKVDKRETIKDRDWKRDQARLMKDNGKT